MKWVRPPEFSVMSLDAESAGFQDDIYGILDDISPLTIHKSKRYNTYSPTWWSTDLERIKKKVNCLLQIARQLKNPEDREIFKKEQNSKRLAELKGQRESLHKFVDCAKDIETLLKLAKAIQ